MLKGSPTRPLSGSSSISQKNARTVYEADGMPRENVTRRAAWCSDPTQRRALALIEAQKPQRRVGARR